MSKKVYCIAQFRPKAGQFDALFSVLQALEAQTQREDGCIQYLVTRHIKNDFAPGSSFPIVFNEVWTDTEAFEAHCQKSYITDFFEIHCVAETGLVEEFNVCVYSDEAE
ncbi:MAG TPA: antibiotic biosynthesis monooxygenase [Psychromonas hadalis]|nr:antibiotic biosynthesis monooxygenase [Psychromonas hadalis]